MDNQEVIKELAEKYESIKKLVKEYNDLSRKNKLGTEVGCIINTNEENEDEDSYGEYDYFGWMPSSLGC